jgi:hypothetical protein
MSNDETEVDADELPGAELPEVDTGGVPELDIPAFVSAAEARYKKMSANPKHLGPVDATYSAWVKNLYAAFLKNFQEAVETEKQVRLDNYAAHDVGEKAVNKSLAGELDQGKFTKKAEAHAKH